jgi:hypothetical protein
MNLFHDVSYGISTGLPIIKGLIDYDLKVNNGYSLVVYPTVASFALKELGSKDESFVSILGKFNASILRLSFLRLFTFPILCLINY